MSNSIISHLENATARQPAMLYGKHKWRVLWSLNVFLTESHLGSYLQCSLILWKSYSVESTGFSFHQMKFRLCILQTFLCMLSCHGSCRHGHLNFFLFSFKLFNVNKKNTNKIKNPNSSLYDNFVITYFQT